MTVRVVARQLAVVRQSAAHRVGSVAAVLLGAATAIYPLGTSAAAGGEGALAGASSGLATGLVVCVFVAAAIATSHVGWDEEEGTARQLFLAGLAPPRRRIGWIAAASVGAVEMIPLAALGGALAAAAQGLDGGAFLGHGWFPGVGAIVAIAGAFYTAVLGAAAAAALRAGAPATVLVAAGFAFFFFLLAVFNQESPLRHVLEVSPYAPLWASALPAGHSTYLLDMHPLYRLAVAATWFAVGVGLAVRRAAPEGGQRRR
ncbi:MAG TPA: hypothetical protein VF230_03965 [Acidimicrobiales bacterium]